MATKNSTSKKAPAPAAAPVREVEAAMADYVAGIERMYARREVDVALAQIHAIQKRFGWSITVRAARKARAHVRRKSA